MKENIDSELKKLPKSPGVYLMHDKDGQIIYVGKAKNLFNRVHQYFQAGHQRTQKINQMISHIDCFEYIVVDNELESLILEANLIKEHMPRYNTLLKDDKNYPYIKVTTYEKFPRILFARRRKNDNSIYFGPFKSAADVRELLDLVTKTYKIRTCNMPINNKKTQKRECLYYHLGDCLASCVNLDIQDVYSKNTKAAINFLSGNYEESLKTLKQQMEDYASIEEFEKAAVCRDTIFSINSLKEKQKIDANNLNDRDIIGLYREADYASFLIFVVRDGKIIDKVSRILSIDVEDKTENIVFDFLKQYYNDSPFVPPEIYVSDKIENDDNVLLEEFVSRNNKKKTKIFFPKKGDKEKLTQMAVNNAKISLRMHLDKNKKKNENIEKALIELKSILHIDNLSKIESFDISNISGTNSVASLVCFQNGNFAKEAYRKYHIKTVLGANDFASMEEVISRRIKHENLPELFLIDGGKGQVNTVKRVLNNSNINIPVMGMVKDDKHRTRGLWYNDQEISISPTLLRLITNIQDETHRFAITFHRSLRSKEQIHSVLDDIKGIGPKKKNALIRYFKTIDAIKEASLEELLTCPGIDKSVANSIISHFKK